MSKEAKELAREIKKEQKKLMSYAKKHGVYEDFGQKEYKRLEDKYMDLYYTDKDIARLLDGFFDWCVSYDGK